MGENINLAFQGVWSHKLRSFLTMLGIIIGIAAIITIVHHSGHERTDQAEPHRRGQQRGAVQLMQDNYTADLGYLPCLTAFSPSPARCDRRWRSWTAWRPCPCITSASGATGCTWEHRVQRFTVRRGRELSVRRGLCGQLWPRFHRRRLREPPLRGADRCQDRPVPVQGPQPHRRHGGDTEYALHGGGRGVPRPPPSRSSTAIRTIGCTPATPPARCSSPT